MFCFGVIFNFGFFLLSIVHGEFPNSDDPITELPLLQRPPTASFSVPIFKEAACASWNTLLTSNYQPPPVPPTGFWNKIILDMMITENGTQFDRYGAFWIGGLEILRTTTAEPTLDGIVWTIEKDITRYADYLTTPNIATLSIPNNVDSTYTGIPLVTMTITFYESNNENPSPLNIPEIYPLTNSPGDWSGLSVTGGSNLTYVTTLKSNDVFKIELDLMASPHGCEEFWYTNIDNDTIASDLGLCGGGVYRELQIYVDSYLAGAVNPYFVLYTGGINPYLWRPLTGIMSFDIPAYKFDLTPFVITDGQEHSITVRVEGGDAQGGVWYLDAALIIYHNESLAPITGEFLKGYDSGSQIVTTNDWSMNGGYNWETNGSHNYSTSGILYTGDGNSIEYTVYGSVETLIANQLTNSASTQLTSGIFNSQSYETIVTPLVPSSSSASSSSSSAASLSPSTSIASSNSYSQTIFPFHINSTYLQDETTFDITASIEMSYRRIFANSISSTHAKEDSFQFPVIDTSEMDVIQWSNNLVSSAQYNRSLDHTTVYVQSDTAHGNYKIASSADQSICYLREVSAFNGDVLNDDQKQENCHLSHGKYICGYDLCQGYPLESTPPPPPLSPPRPPLASSDLRGGDSKPQLLPFRHPLMGKKFLEAATITHDDRNSFIH